MANPERKFVEVFDSFSKRPELVLVDTVGVAKDGTICFVAGFDDTGDEPKTWGIPKNRKRLETKSE